MVKDTKAEIDSAISSDDEASTTVEKKEPKRKTAAEIRNIQREKKRMAREGHDETRENAHSYIKQWAEDRSSWKFNSAKQRWIAQHIYMESLVPADIFDVAVDYLASSQGMLRDTMVEDARLVVDPMLANNTDSQKRRRRALGMLPSHVTKAEAKASKKAKSSVKPAAADENGDDQDEAAEQDIDNNVSDVTTPENIIERAKRIIEALSKKAGSHEKALSKSKEKKKSEKRKRSSSDDSDDSDDEGSLIDESPKKKIKKAEKDKKKDKKDNKKDKKKYKKKDKKDKKGKKKDNKYNKEKKDKKDKKKENKEKKDKKKDKKEKSKKSKSDSK
ncbi:hypothetical protein GGI25_005624 [Coemansia spiralis]|uniref:WKF domain-containing protein n=1 Tax=Coemansia spiralis TaxID=417178 RepID=A0A9W8KWA4_9FUNG|nr:hypothetical protein GGI25_005624 [Coemansia spiralis]